MAIHSSTLVCKIPGMEEPGRLHSMGSQRVGHDWSNLAAVAAGHSYLLPLVSRVGVGTEEFWWAVLFSLMGRVIVFPNSYKLEFLGCCSSSHQSPKSSYHAAMKAHSISIWHINKSTVFKVQVTSEEMSEDNTALPQTTVAFQVSRIHLSLNRP